MLMLKLSITYSALRSTSNQETFLKVLGSNTFEKKSLVVRYNEFQRSAAEAIALSLGFSLSIANCNST